MKSESKQPFIFNSISELHRALGLPKPLHPLVSLVDYGNIKSDTDEISKGMILNFFKVSYKRNFHGKIKYGQHYYDFDEGGLSFISPNQIISAIANEADYGGFTLLFHSDFIRNYPLGKNIRNYGFFSYSASEALYLSEKEQEIIIGIFKNIGHELSLSIDHFSQDIILSQIEQLLNYSNRFYNRQFITRKTAHSDLLTELEKILANHFDNSEGLVKGLPSVLEISEKLNVSQRYLSDMLRQLTGQNTQQHIHNRLINKAKEILSTTDLTVGEIAYQLGFEHPQSFNKLFKNKTKVSPVEFRRSFN
ncbi:helix-turn-helix domain-containing protein [Dyadobacter frigoris]|uniref:Helix-turn-helix domain-containing protein n=1 Tax=Dyadobacter frigoris TaxID=2576211 RepID=A0A4U6D948_9BACT|nr:response regulator transcription factor [Dyadobacter frigoris]TKT92797.1 helix-turn-helix domain-containing protein [Dyadobacter frigoris]GLU54494.1 AraC family transcriptional regulator [Dyadobacter frigoris]